MTATKKTAAPAEPKKLKGWECSHCGQYLNASQMELQPKTCTSCGKGKLKPVTE